MAGRGHAHHPGSHVSQKQRVLGPHVLRTALLGHSFPSGAGLQLLHASGQGRARLGQGSPGERGPHPEGKREASLPPGGAGGPAWALRPATGCI